MSRKPATEPYESEAEFERQVLLDVGPRPDLLIRKNEVGMMFKPTIIPAIQTMLKEAGLNRDEVSAVVDRILHHRMMVGLGVGSPDLVFSYRGRAGGIELKSATGSLSDVQENAHRAMRARGMPVIEARTVAEVRSFIDEVGGSGALERMGRGR